MAVELQYGSNLLAKVPAMTEDATWRAIDPRDRHRFACESSDICAQDAAWATRTGSLCVCGYHRFLHDVQRALKTVLAEAVLERAAQ